MMFKVFFLLAALCQTAAFAKCQGFQELIYQLRNPETGAEEFRDALASIGELLALDVLNELSTKEVSIETLTGAKALHRLVDETPVLITILRAGIPLNAGVQRIFPDSEVGFLAMSRDEETLKAKIDYVALPELSGRAVILTDTMLATGGSLLDAIKIIEQGRPSRIFVIAAIAAEPGIQRVLAYNPQIKIFAAAIDPTLNERGYIVPGLGDAGDRAYGKKWLAELRE